MISNNSTRAKIIQWLRTGSEGDGANEVFLAHIDGILRGLALALTGKDVGTYVGGDTSAYLNVVGVPHFVQGKRVEFIMCNQCRGSGSVPIIGDVQSADCAQCYATGVRLTA